MLVRYSQFSKDLKLNENIAGAKKVLKDTYILNKALKDLDLGYKTDASGMFLMDKTDAPVDFKDLPEDTKAEVKIIYQTVEDLHKACPKNLGDWYFTGDYPTDGGNRVVNRAFMNFYEGKDARAY